METFVLIIVFLTAVIIVLVPNTIFWLVGLPHLGVFGFLGLCLLLSFTILMCFRK